MIMRLLNPNGKSSWPMACFEMPSCYSVPGPNWHKQRGQGRERMGEEERGNKRERPWRPLMDWRRDRKPCFFFIFANSW